MLRWWHSGFSLHAEVRVHAEDRDGLERLIRYCARPDFASENLKWVRKGKLLAYTLPKLNLRGQYQLLLDPIQLIDRMAALIPPPRLEKARDPPQMEFEFTQEVYRADIDLLFVFDEAVVPFPEIVDPPHQEEFDGPHIDQTANQYDIFEPHIDDIDQTTHYEDVFVEPEFNWDQTINW